MTGPAGSASSAAARGPRPSATYGFSPLLLGPDDQFLALFHGDDERVSVEALHFGLPVLYDVVRRFCG